MDTAKTTADAPTLASLCNAAGDMESDLCHLVHLLDATVWHMQGMDASGSGPDGRNHDLDRANAFVWIARDIVDKLAAQATALSSSLAKAGA